MRQHFIVTLEGGRQTLVGGMRHEAAFLCPPLVDMRHAEAVELQDAANHDGSQHVVEIRHSIHAVTLQLPR